MPESSVSCVTAAEFLEKRLGCLQSGNDVVKLVQFNHESPGIRKVRRQIAYAIIETLERNGFAITSDRHEHYASMSTAVENGEYTVCE